MSDWIKQRAEEIRNAEKQKKLEAERRATAASDLKTQILPYWADFVDSVKQSVAEFNSEFPDASRRIDVFERPDSDTFTVRRTAFPSVTVKAQLNNAATTVQYTISRVPRKGMNTVEKQDSFSYLVKDDKPCYANPLFQSHEDVTKVLLDAFFEF